jgi:hypothetical protein
MSSRESAIQLTGLTKQRFALLAARAKRLGLTPERYLAWLVDEDLSISAQFVSTYDERWGRE